MNYKDTLYFIEKSLVIAYDEKAYLFVFKAIRSNMVDWEKVVQVSTQHYVLPALCCNLKKRNLLVLLPKDLIAFMEYITDLNRDRNHQILQQVKDITEY